MNNIGKLRSEIGERVARWLNGPGNNSRLGLVIGLCARLASSEAAGKLRGRITVRQAFKDWVRRVNEVVAVKGGRFVSSELPLRTSALGVDFELSFSIEKGNARLDIEAVNKDSEVLLGFATLTELGGARRLRLCPQCDKFFYARRTDRRFCSVLCKVNFWQATDKGKETKREYMRNYRATVRQLDEKYVKNDLTGERRKESRRNRRLG